MLKLQMPMLTSGLCGAYRDGHFEGVMMVVARLLHLFAPHRVYFGKKDYQQYRVVSQMVRDLAFPVEVVGVETIREDDGLAMSSRNARLDGAAREHAALLYRALRVGEKSYREGKRVPGELKEIIQDIIHTGSYNRVEYVDMVDPATLQPQVEEVRAPFLIAAAIYTGGVRLIDNLLVGD